MDNYNEFGVNNNDEFFEENNYKDDKKTSLKISLSRIKIS